MALLPPHHTISLLLNAVQMQQDKPSIWHKQYEGKLDVMLSVKKADGSVLTAVEDPGTAAAIIMVKTAECKGIMTDESRDMIKAIIKDEIGMEDSDEVVPFSEWVSNQIASPNDIIRQYKSLWMSNLNPTQMSEFIDMVQRVASHDGEANAEQKEIVRQMRIRLLS